MRSSARSRRRKIAELQQRLEEAEETLRALRSGEVDSLVLEGPEGPRLYALEGVNYAYRVLVAKMSEGALSINEQGVILYCNSRFAAMLEAPLHQVMGSAIYEYIPASYRSAFAALWHQAATADSRGELALRTPHGRELPVQLSMSCVEDGYRRAFCIIATDLGPHKRDEQIVGAVLQQNAEPVLVCDESGRVLRASRSAEELFANNPLLRPFDELLPLTRPVEPGSSHRYEGEPLHVAAAALRGEVLQAIPAILHRPDGSAVELLVSAKALLGIGDRAIGCVVTLVDVTHLRRTEAERRISQAKFAGIIAVASDAIVSVDEQQRIVNFNRGAETIFGYSDSEVIGKPLDLLLPERYQGVHRRHIASFSVDPVPSRKMGERRTIWGRRKTGEEFPAEASISKLEVAGAQLYTVALQDISERKRLEDELRGSENKFRTLAEAMPQIVWITRSDGWNTYFNQQWVRYTGLTLEESYGHGWNIPFHPEDRQRAWEAWQQAVQTDGVYNLEARLRRADGIYRWWLIRGVSVHDESGKVANWFGTCTDVDDIKKTEEALRKARDEAEAASEKLRVSEERFRLTIDEAPIGMALVALDGRFVRVNHALCEIVGYSPAELTTLTFQDITHPDDLDADVALADKLARGEIPRYQLEKRYLRKDGTSVDIMLNASILRNQEGAPLYFIAQVEDITERKLAEAALKASEERLNLALDSAQMGIWDLDLTSDTAVRSLRHDQIFGYPSLLPSWGFASFLTHIIPEDREGTKRSFDHALASGLLCLECRVLWPDQSIHWISAQGRVVSRDPAGSPVRMLGTILDITERKRMEEERARTLQEKETLLKEVHHRVKNNLQVLSSLFYLQRQRTAEEPLRTLLDESRNRIQSIALIHEKLYQSERLAWIDFGDYLKDLTSRLRSAIGAQSPKARISIQADKTFLDIERAIPCALIVNELVSNSLKHAFPGGRSGEIRITVGLVAPDLLELAVSDTGIGFPADLDFKNTKTLGMKLVCSLTNQLRGTVKLSRDGGTRFEIRFSVPPRLTCHPAKAQST